MSDLRQNRFWLTQLANFILSREGFDPYFYCDSLGFVTIGIGTLVATEQDARRIAADPNVTFTAHAAPSSRVTEDDVAADWRRVQSQPGLPEHAYQHVAHLRLDRASVEHLMMQEVTRAADALYKAHPFLLNFDPRVAMAFVDTRYNPAGVNPYRSIQTRPLWQALDPASPAFNLNRALAQFETIWANRGGKLKGRYVTRHWQRVQWFRQGIEAMGGAKGPMSL